MSLKDFINYLKSDLGNHDFGSTRNYAASTLRTLQRSTHFTFDRTAADHVKQKAPSEFLECDRNADLFLSDTGTEPLPEFPSSIIARLAGMKVPGGALWIENKTAHHVDGHDPLSLAILLEEVDDGINCSQFIQQGRDFYLPDINITFHRDGKMSTHFTAEAISLLRDIYEEAGPQVVIDRCIWAKGENRKRDLWEMRHLLAAAWMICNKDPKLKAAITAPIAKGSSPARIRADIRAIHPNRLFSDFPGLEDAGVFNSDLPVKANFGIEDLLGGIQRQISIISMDYLIWASDLPIERRPENPLFVIRGLQDMNNLHAGFKRSGAHIFHLNGELSTILGQTDLNEITCNDIKLPYDNFYLSFEERIPFFAKGEALIFEGAYIRYEKSEKTIAFAMIISPAAPESSPLANFRNPISFTLRLEAGISLEAALLNSLETNDYDVSEAPPVTVSEETIAMAAEMGITLRAVDKSSSALLSEMHESAFSSVADCLKIIGNSLILLTSRPEQIIDREEWAGASETTLYQLAAPSQKGKDRGRKMAIEEGCLPVRMLSLLPALTEEIQAVRNDVAEENRRGSPSVAYWRKGYWRRQPYGPGRSLSYDRWIMPTLCNEKAPLRAAGSLYENDRDVSPEP